MNELAIAFYSFGLGIIVTVAVFFLVAIHGKHE